MPSPRTECTELAVAFGLLQTNPTGISYDEVSSSFEGTLPAESFARFQTAFDDFEDISLPLFNLGTQLIDRCPELFPRGANVRWMGPLKQSGTVTVSQDLIVGATAVSVKENSLVVYNLSPYNLCESIPSGRVLASKTGNWYLRTAPAEYEDLFQFIAPMLNNQGIKYGSVLEFEETAAKAERTALQELLQLLSGPEATEFDRRYRRMCHATAAESAKIFAQNLQSMEGTPHADGVRDLILKYFLRLGDTRYVLAGLDNRRPFALLVPSITEWKRQWELVTAIASADTTAGQSVVDFEVRVRRKKGSSTTRLRFHAEIRWSHGKFCGNPEGKLYRNFVGWADVPGVTVLV